jgi:hypothetical protein
MHGFPRPTTYHACPSLSICACRAFFYFLRSGTSSLSTCCSIRSLNGSLFRGGTNVVTAPGSITGYCSLSLFPIVHDGPGDLLSIVPALSFNESLASSEDEGEVHHPTSPTTLLPMISRFRSQFSSLKGKWARAFTKVEACCGLLEQDIIKKLHLVSTSLHASIGDPGLFGCSPPGSLWEGLGGLHNLITL